MTQGSINEILEIPSSRVTISDDCQQPQKMDSTFLDVIYKNLGKKYLTVYLLATLADWLQGPYLYRLYETRGYDRNSISFLYVTGFASSTISGLLIGHLADKFGRKRLCIIYSLTTTINCLITSLTKNYSLLTIARIFGGASTSILFSAFESWYVGQHLSRYKLNGELICEFLAKSTFLNGLLAIFAGYFSSILVDTLEFGPLAPFLLAIPVSLLSGYFCAILWPENPPSPENLGIVENLKESLKILLFSSGKKLLLLLGLSQSLFETVVYIFVFLWTPILEPMGISQGFVFGTFMLAIMLGSMFASMMMKSHIKRENFLFVSIVFGAFSIFGSTLGVYLQQIKFGGDTKAGSIFCFYSFFFFEFSVGIYYPAVGYLRGIVVPESHRASIANWFRLPSNFLICLGLLYIGIKIPNNCIILGSCCFALFIASITSYKFSKNFKDQFKERTVGKSTFNFLSIIVDFCER